MKMYSLDVGCGDSPRGQVNVDKNKKSNPEITVSTVSINYKKIPNFVVASGLFLPFRDESFEKVFCYDVIEHTDKPKKMLDELIRVASHEIHIKTPHRFGKLSKLPYHKSYFTLKWFYRNVKYRMTNTIDYRFPLRFTPLIMIPNTINIKIIKGAREVK